MDKYAWLRAAENHALVLRDGEYLTPPRIYKMGIWVCYTCGEFNVLECSCCRRCFEDRFFILLKYDTMNPAKLQMELENKLHMHFKGKEWTSKDVAVEAVRMADVRMENYHIAAEVWRFCAVLHDKFIKRDVAMMLVDDAMQIMRRGKNN